MFLRKSTNKKTGRTYLSIVHNYRDKDSQSTRPKLIRSIGYVDELVDQYPDPIAHFSLEAKRLEEERKKETAMISLSLRMNEVLPLNSNHVKNFGYTAFSQIYHELGIHTFFTNRQRHTKEQYDADTLMKLLVYGRLLCPSSKKKTFELREKFFEKTAYSLDDIYRFLTFAAKRKDALLRWLHNQIQIKYGRDTSLVYYDVTNFYFEIDGPDGYLPPTKEHPHDRIPDEFRKNGVCKEHRPNPIVQMGLFVDRNGLPITYGLFPGNTNDCLTYRPNLRQIKADFGIERTIVVADKGMSTGDNIWYTLSAKDGYVFSMSVRGATKEIKDYVLNQANYTWLGKEYKRKSRRSPRSIWVTRNDGGKMKKIVHEKQVVFYSEKYSLKAKADRAKAIAKAQRLIANPSAFNRITSYGCAQYIKNLAFDKESGEILETDQLLSLDDGVIREQEQYDGYYLIVTSEMEETDDHIIEMYRGLWKIEDAFRVTKSDLEGRPMFVSREDHIEAHFLTCFVALLIVRLLQMRTEHKYSVACMLESLGNANAMYISENHYLFGYFDQCLADIGAVLGIDFSKKYRTLGDIKKIIAQTKK